MKRYERYKPSGIDWIGEIPETWIDLKNKYCSKILNGYAFKSEEYVESGLPVIRIGDIRPVIILDSCKRVPSSYLEEYSEFRIQKGDILLALTGATIGKSTVYDLDEPALLNQRVAVVRPQNGIIQRYLRYIIFSHFFRRHIDLECEGGAQENIGKEEIGRFSVSMPSMKEQTAIANYLDRKTAQIDDLIAKKQKLIDLLDEEKTAIINQAVTKGLNPNTPMKDSGIPWLGEIPTHWEIKKIKYIANLTLGKMLTGEDKGGNFLKPYLRAQNISWFKCDTSDVKEMWFSQSELIKYRVNLNDLLVSEGGDVGRTCIWMNELDECYIQNSVHKITFKKYFNPKYFLYLFYCFGRKGYFFSIVNQISIGHLTGEKLKEVFTIFPGFDEQTAIVDYLDRKTDQMDDVISKTHHEIELLQEYRTALISEAVTGKIDVRI